MRVSFRSGLSTSVVAFLTLLLGQPRLSAAQTPIPTARPGLVPAAAAKGAVRCAKAIGKAANGFVTQKAALLEKCTDAVASCVQGAPSGQARCLTQVRVKCDEHFARIEREAAQLLLAVPAGCTKVASADLRAEAGLGFGLPAVAAACAEVGVPALADAADMAGCLARFHACQVERLLSVQEPLAENLLGLVGRLLESAHCARPTPLAVPTPRAGLSVPAAAKEAITCTKAIGKLANGFVTRKQGLLKKCTDAVGACLQGGDEGRSRCLTQARGKCDEHFAGIVKEEAKLVRKLPVACVKLASADLLSEAGLGFGLPGLQAACEEIGVGRVPGAEDLAACIARHHGCRVEQLLSVQVPLASYLLGLVGRPLASGYCAQPTPLPTSTAGVDPGATPTASGPASTATDPGPTPTPGGPFAAAVNPGLVPGQGSILDPQGDPLPIAASRDAAGVQTDFLEGLMIVKPRDASELQAFLARYDGAIVADDTIPEPPAEAGITLTPEARAPTAFLVRIDLDLARVADVVANAEASGMAGVIEFSTENGLKTFAGVMDARAQGFVVSGDFVYQGHQAFPSTLFRTEEQPLIPAPTAVPTPVYTDPFVAPAYADFGATGNQSNVTAAWQFVAAHGIERRVRVAIIDNGFWLDPQGRALGLNSDFPAPPARPLQWDVDFEDDTAAGSNGIGCGALNRCYWHGTGSAGAAMGIANNRLGGAGSGWQVADPILLRFNGTKAQRNTAVRIAIALQADVVSMSFGGDCNVWCRIDDRVDNPFDEAVGAGSRVVFVASAGNGRVPPNSPPLTPSVGYFVGDPNFVHPCTEESVICVGALNPNANSKILYSNFGGKVEIFAPTGIPVMSYPSSFDGSGAPLPPSQAAGPEVRQVFTGTSASAPFVAGVAAMIKALDPTLGHGAVAQILRDTAQAGAAPLVTRTLDAQAAVRRAAVGSAIVPDALEPNEVGAPRLLGSLPSYQRMNLNLDSQDRDFFIFDAPAASLMTLTLAYPQTLGAISVVSLLSVNEDCGQPVLVSESPRAGGGKILVYRVPGGLLRLGLQADGVTAYNLGITFGTAAYPLDEYEANDTAATARYVFSFKAVGTGPFASVGRDPRVTIGATMHGGDVDWFMVRGVRPSRAESTLLLAYPALVVFGNDSPIGVQVYRRNADGTPGESVTSVNSGTCTTMPLTVRLEADVYYLVRVEGAPGRYTLRNGVAGDPRKIPLLVRDRVFEILNPLDPVVRPIRHGEAFVLIADAGYAQVRTTTPGMHLRLLDFDGNAIAEGVALDPGPGEAVSLAGTVPGQAYGLLVEPAAATEPPPVLELIVDVIAPVRVSENLIVNAGAEIVGGDPFDDFLGWDLVPGVAAPRHFFYDDQEGNPSLSDPGPPARGFHLFAGGDGNAEAGLRQLVFVDQDWRAAINAGRVRFRFEAFLGGYQEQGDFASATVTFLSVNQQPLGIFALPAVTPVEREGQTGLLAAEVEDLVPPDTVFLTVDLRFTRVEGDFNDGYADALGLTFSELAP